MQVKVRQLLSTAAVATAALIRFLKGYASPLAEHDAGGEHHGSVHQAHSASRTTPLSLMLGVSHVFRQRHSSVEPILSKTGCTHQLSERPCENQRSLVNPQPFQDDPLKTCPNSTSQGVPLHPCSPPAAVSASVAQQAACILGHLRPSPDLSFLADAPAVLSHKREDNTGKVPLVKEAMLSDVSTELVNSLLCQKEGAKGSMLRTILACEGMAINCLFSHGRPTSRV
jgi:hypothetical protein